MNKSKNIGKNEASETKANETYNLLDTWMVSMYKDSEQELRWLDIQKWENETELHTFSGKAWIKNDVLIVSSCKVHDGIKETIENWNNHLKNLPTWKLTKYFVKVADIGDTGLRYCKNGEVVDEKIAKPIIESITE